MPGNSRLSHEYSQPRFCWLRISMEPSPISFRTHPARERAQRPWSPSRSWSRCSQMWWCLADSRCPRWNLSGSLGRKVIEVHAPKAGKGTALAALIPSEDPGAVVCFGDDENDRSMFEYVYNLEIPHWCVGVWSPEAPQGLFDRCDVVVQGPAGATAVLEEIVEWAKESS